MRAVIGNRALPKAGAGETTVGRFEKEILLEGDNLNNLDEILKQWTEVDEICECIKIEDKGVWFKPVVTTKTEPFLAKNDHLFWVKEV